MFSLISPEVESVQLDHGIFNLVYIIINVYQIIRHLRKLIKPDFDDQEKIMYERDFKDIFSEVEFKILLSKSRKDYYSNNISQICTSGQTFKELIYIAYIHEDYSVVLEDDQGKLISILKPGSWIGIIEVSKMEAIMSNPNLSRLVKEGKLELVWQVSAVVKKTKDLKSIVNRSTKIIEEEEENNFKENEKNVFIGHEDDKELEALLNEDPTAFHLKLFLKNRNTGCVVLRFAIEVGF